MWYDNVAEIMMYASADWETRRRSHIVFRGPQRDFSLVLDMSIRLYIEYTLSQSEVVCPLARAKLST